MPPPPSNGVGVGVGRGGDVVRRSDKQHHHHQQQRSPIELALPPVHAGARAAPEDFPLPPAPKRRRLGIADAFGQMSLHRRSKLNPALGAQVSLYDSVTSPEESVEAGTGSMVGAGRGPSRNTSFGSSSASGDASTDLELLDSSDVDDESDATSMDEGRTDHLPSLHELSASSTGHQDPVDARIEELIRTSRIRAMVSARREAEGRSILRPSDLEAIPSSSPPLCPSPVPRRRSVDLHGKPSSTRSADSGHKRTSTSPKELRSQDWLIEEMAAVEDETHVSPVNIVPVYRGRATTRRATGMRSRSLPRQLETGSSSRTRKAGCTSSDIDTAP